MRFTIDKLILWPKDSRLPLRTLEFRPDAVNLVTGRSRTGKSAITYIIDYVLGSSKCAIPVGDIRRTVSWYGILAEVDGGQVLLAREEPGGRVESGNYYLAEGFGIVVPLLPVKNTNRDAVKQRLNLLAGLPNLGLDAEEPSRGYAARPGFRDMAAFNFLPQHIVANPYTLFFKTDTTEHRQRLRMLFPFVLGAVTAEHLAAEHELADLERRYRRLSGQLAQRARAGEAWKAEAFGLHARAVDLGLLPQDTPRPSSQEACIQVLSTVPVRGRALPSREPGTTLAATVRLEQVQRLEREADRALGDARVRLRRLRDLRESLGAFGGAATELSGRVQGVGWLSKKLPPSAPCPVCGNEHDKAQARMSELSAAAAELSARQRSAGNAPVALQKEEQTLLSDIRGLEEQLRDLRTERRELEALRAADGGGQSLEEVYRFVGRVEEALKNLKQTEDDGELQREVDAIQSRIEQLRQFLDEGARRRRLGAALQKVSRGIAHYAAFLGLERAQDVVNLKIDDLTLVFTGQDAGREDYLWEIGSGANWMGYHLAALLALHEVLLERNSPVPTFLVVDQPSQVYFPAGVPAPGERQERQHDIEATRKIFESFVEALQRMDHRLQVIVTEHVDHFTLAGVPWLHTVANWHGEAESTDYLIPRAWLRN